MEGGGSLFVFSIYIYSSRYSYKVTLTTGGKILIQNYRELNRQIIHLRTILVGAMSHWVNTLSSNDSTA